MVEWENGTFRRVFGHKRRLELGWGNLECYMFFINSNNKVDPVVDIFQRSPEHILKEYASYPDSKVYGANMGPIWVRKDPGGLHVGPMNFAIWVCLLTHRFPQLDWESIIFHQVNVVLSLWKKISEKSCGIVCELWCRIYNHSFHFCPPSYG